MPRSCFPILMMIALGTLAAEGCGQGPSLPQLPNIDPSKIDPMKLLQSGDPIKALEGLLGAEGKEVGKAIRGVSAYPKETRAGILQLAMFTTQYPNLIKDLIDVRTKPDAEIDRYLTSNNYPNELQQAAATVLVDAPDTLSHMLEHPAMVGIIGKAYSIPPGRQAIEMILEKAAIQTEQIRKNATDSWANKLQQKPELMNQYGQMLEQYTKSRHGADAQQDPTWQSYNYGVTKSANGYSVNDVPSAEVINYALANGYQWSMVVAALIQQYLYNQNTQEYQDAVGGWYSNYGSSIPSDARTSQDNYYDMLQELANYASAYASQYGDESYGSSGDGDSSGYGSSDEETAAAAAAGGAAGAAGATAAGEYINRQQAKDVAGNAYQNAGQYLANNAGNYPNLSNWLGANGVDLASAANVASTAGTAANAANLANAGRNPGGSPFSDRKNHPPGAGQGSRPGTPGQSPFGNAPPFAGGQPPFSLPGGQPPFSPPGGTPFGPGGASPFGGGGAPGSASPFSDRSKSTPLSNRAQPSSPMGQGQGNPFSALAGGGMPKMPSGGFPQMPGGPSQITRGMPNIGQQLSRAQGQMSSAWRPGGMPSINGGMPRMGGGMPMMGGPGGGGPRMGGPGGGGPRPGGPGGGGPRPGPFGS